MSNSLPMIAPPAAGTYAAFYETYISKLNGQDPVHVLERLVLEFKALLSEVPDEKEGFRYAEGKWSVKEVVGHIIDTERILCTRALCIARGEKQSLPGFDENEYVAAANFDKRSLYELSREFGYVREGTLSFFKTLGEEELDRNGIANNNSVTPRVLLYVIAGHHLHHLGVLKERYLQDIL
ncbi:MAG: DinB family protein [Bacteroidota bacterium]|nr:DinB family protein [Bacteroidota bacterium]